jgi:hypothetical protein
MNNPNINNWYVLIKKNWRYSSFPSDLGNQGLWVILIQAKGREALTLVAVFKVIYDTWMCSPVWSFLLGLVLNFWSPCYFTVEYICYNFSF